MNTAASGNRLLLRVLRESVLPVYLVNLRSEIAYGNEAFADWVGQPLDSLIGQNCRSDPRFAGLLPPRTAPEAQQAVEWFAIGPGENGPQSRQGWAKTLVDSDGDIEATLVVLAAADSAPPAASLGGEASVDSLRTRLAELRWSHGWGAPPDVSIGNSAQAARIRLQIQAAAGCQAPVVVAGPKGTRRRQIVEAIHAGSAAGHSIPLQAARCRLLDAELLQSTIRAAASAAKSSAAEQAALLLLDVEELSPETQEELIGFLRLPGFSLRVFATARTALEDSNLAPELAQRLSVLTMKPPPLIARIEDLPMLAQHHIEQFNQANDRHISHVEEPALDLLTQCGWAGNYREFADVMLEACAKAVENIITTDELPGYIAQAADAEAFAKPEPVEVALDDFLAEVETELIRRALKASAGNRAEAARSLQISRPRLLRRIEQLKIE